MRFLIALSLTTAACTGCRHHDEPDSRPKPIEPGTTAKVDPDAAPAEVGLNFVLIGEGDRPSERNLSVEETRTEFEALGVQRFRQLAFADVQWRNIEPEQDAWNWDRTDVVLHSFGDAVIPTLFALQYANATPPWRSRPEDKFDYDCTDDTRDYVATVVARYKDDIEYWEIGNEMDHWRAADPDSDPRRAEKQNERDKKPPNVPPEGFTPQQQGKFLACVAEVIRANDPDAKIVMPGMGGVSDYQLDTWLGGVIEGGGKDLFDVVNYHLYGPWNRVVGAHVMLDEKLKELGLQDKPVWLTETGVTSDLTLTQRTDYPNSQEQQAADIFRRMALAYALGDDLVLWHTFVDSGGQNPWRGYGLIDSEHNHKLSWYSYRLLTHEVLPFTSATAVELGPERYVLQFEREGGTRWVVWGAGKFETPPEAVRQTPTVYQGDTAWERVKGGIELTDIPVLFATEN